MAKAEKRLAVAGIGNADLSMFAEAEEIRLQWRREKEGLNGGCVQVLAGVTVAVVVACYLRLSPGINYIWE